MGKDRTKRNALSGNPIKILDMPTFVLPATLVFIAVIAGIAIPQAFSAGASKTLEFLTTNFGWFYAIGATILLVFCFWAAFSKAGNVKLGGKDAKPEMKFGTWFAIVLCSGMAIGISFYGIAEPLANYIAPPVFAGYEGSTQEAAEGALKYAFLHWALHPYAIYTSAGICCAFIIMNGKKKFQVSSSLYPLIGEKANGTLGKVINSVCIFSLIGGIGTSLGFGITQIATGINYVFGTHFSSISLALIIIVVMATTYILAACTGILKGIKHVSNFNVLIYLAMLLIAIVFGNTLFIINNTTSSLGQYLAFLIPQSFYLEPAHQAGWVQNNSVFYWAWWLSFAPLVGLFLVKLSKGRTIRQFVLVNMIAPALFAIAWFGVFGSAAISMEMSGGNLASEIAQHGTAVSLFAFAKAIPPTAIFIVLSFGCVALSFITLAQSMTLTISEMVVKESEMEKRVAAGKGAPKYLIVFWGVLIGAIAFVLLYSGGLEALQTSSIVCGLPILILLLFMVVSFIKSMKHRSQYDLTLSDEEREELAKLEDRKNSSTPI